MVTPPAFAFVHAPLDRADALRDDAAKLAGWWPYSRVIVLDEDGRAFANDDLSLLEVSGLRLQMGDGIGHDNGVFLGIERNPEGSPRHGWFALAASKAGQLHAPQRVDLRTAAAQWPAQQATLFAQARALLHWQQRHRHCGVCGATLHLRRGGWHAHCAGCGIEHYPRTDPAVIVAVGDGERLLLGRQASWPAHRYSTLAGFVEPGETLEQAVAREVLEESGVRVHASRYLASQPWPFPGSLMLGFTADAAPDAPQVGDELEDARWFTRAQVARALTGDDTVGELQLSPSLSISRWLIECWYAAGGASAG